MRKFHLPFVPTLLALALWLGLAETSEARFIAPDEITADASLAPAIELLKKGEADKAKGLVEAEAAKDNKDAQFIMGFLYQQGLGVTGDYAKAKEWYKKAADAGHQAARNNLGVLMMAYGDNAEAGMAMIEEAANASFGKAQISLGQIYLDGLRVEKDAEQARKWLERALTTEEAEAAHLLGMWHDAAKQFDQSLKYYERAAGKKYIPAMIQLGNKYLEGAGVEKDPKAAREWFTKAMDAGSPAAKMNLGQLYESGIGVEKDAKKALQYYQEAADAGDLGGSNKLGYFLENGLGTTKDETKAAEWYKKGADKGHAMSIHNYAMMCEAGKGVKKDEAEAAKLLYKAASAGFGPSQSALGARYREGKLGLPKDPISAMAWLEKAASGGDVNSQIVLANIMESGEAGGSDVAAAAKLYLDAAQKGHPVGMYQIASMLETGRGMEPDGIKAYAFYLAASKSGLKDATAKLDELKKKLSPEQIKSAEAFLAQLTNPNGAASPPAPAPAPAPEKETKTESKKETKKEEPKKSPK